MLKKEIIVGSYTDKRGKSLNVNVKREIRFIDSLKFMSSSLDTLVDNLEIKQFKIISKFYEGNKLDLLLRKEVFPYAYVNS